MTREAGRHFLQIPGPTNVPGRILRAIERPTIDHRGPAFGVLCQGLLADLKSVFRTEQPVIVFPVVLKSMPFQVESAGMNEADPA